MKHYINEVGTDLILNCGVDISTASAVRIYYTKPSGTSGYWTAEVYNSNYVRYTLAANDLNEAGLWKLQAYVNDGTWIGKGEAAELTVYPEYDAPIGTLTAGTNSFCTMAEAESYFTTRLNSAAWREATPADRIAAIVSAFKQIRYCGLFDISASATEQVIKDAQCELALFLLIHQEDMDIRAGLQAQGVAKAGITQEEFKENSDGPMIPANVKALLADYAIGSSPLYATDLTRNDDEDV